MIPGVGLRRRILFLFFATCLAFLILAGRLAYLQIVRGDELRAEALENRLWEVEVQAKRGTILDRNGHELAISVSADSVYVVPAEIRDPEATARQLAEVLGLAYPDVYGRITRHASFSWVQRKVADDTSRRLRELNIPGVYFTQESRRLYPKGVLAAHVLGIAGIDNQGLEGIEYQYDEQLRGEPGAIKVEFDAYGREIPQATQQFIPSQDGLSLRLTIDENIQYIAERELDRAMLAHQAEAGYILVMDPRTGELLALAIRPVFDPNAFADYAADLRRNRAISDVFPPGSAFKPITAAAALEEGTVTPETPFYDPGYFKVPGHTIHNWNHQGLGSTTFAGGFKESANTIFARVAVNHVGTENFYRYLRAFGFTEETGIDLPGEAEGISPPEDRARPVDIAVMGFGQTVTVTPIQMITAISALANDGMLMRPHVAKALYTPEGELVRTFQPEPVRQVVSSQTAQTVRRLMNLVVEDGTGTRAQIQGYRVGGKTGTSQKVIGGRLAPGHYAASFIGMVPVNDPRVVIYVVLDEPQGIYYGGWVAAPVFAKVARDVLQYLDVPADYEQEPQEVQPLPDPTLVPNVVNLPVNEAIEVLRYAGFRAVIRGEGSQVTGQFPNAGVRIPGGNEVILAVDGEFDGLMTFTPVTVPDVLGLERDEAAARLAAVGLRLDAHGEGVAVDQEPRSGVRVPGASYIRVLFEPTAGRPPASENGSANGP